MKHTPYYFQNEAVNAFLEYYQSIDSGHGLIVLPTGTGKSLIQAMIADEMTKRFPEKRILFLTHQPTLIEQNFKELIINLGIIDAGIYCAKFGSRDSNNHIVFASIQSVYKKALELGRFGLIVVDEAHLISPNDETMYRKFFIDILNQSIGCKIIGLTATPYRTTTGLLTEGENKIFNDIIYEYPLYKAIKEGYTCKPIGRAGIVRPDTSKVKKRGGEFVEKELNEVCDNDIIIQKAVSEIVELTQDRKHLLLFCAGITHAEHVAAEMYKQGIECRAIHSKLSASEQQEIADNFKSGKLKAVANVDMWTTGFNFREIDCIIMLRPTMSTGLYVQMCLDLETEILTKRGFLKYNEIEKNDIPYSYNINNNLIEEDEIKNITIRNLEKNESFFYAKGTQVDFRITNDHDLLVRTRRKIFFKKEKIKYVIKRKDFIEIPVSGIQLSSGAILSDYEIEFLGWFLSDGSLNKKTNAITISQSTTNIIYANEIENCIKKCGLKYGKYIIKRKNKYADQIIFTISKGIPRGRDSFLKGWNQTNLKYFLDKNLNDNYEFMNKKQLLILLESLNKGDGCKRKTKDYNVKTHVITMGDNKIYAERMQSLLIRRGFKCNLKIVKYASDWNKNPKDQYLLKIKDTQYITIPGTNIKDGKIFNKKEYKRTHIIEEGYKNEKIWCIETNNGTIITRRNGKVLIMGNSGRGFRIHPDKKDFLLLDYAGNILTHGPLDKIYVETKGLKKDRGVQTAPMKECAGCGQPIPLSTVICKLCGYEYPVNVGHGTEAANVDPISKYKPPEEINLEYDDTNFSLHESKNGKISMRVSYSIGMLQSVSEYICIEHGGYAEQMARKWLRQSLPDGCPIPDTVDECLQLKDLYKRPCTIFIDYNQRFPRIISRIFPDVQEEKKEEIIIDKKFVR